jgi:putative ABC transport system ATP-binding protein
MESIRYGRGVREMIATGTDAAMIGGGAGEALRLASVTKVYGGTSPITALREVSLALAAASFTSVMGPSGSGKSTLLQCAAGLDEPTSGVVSVGGEAVPYGDETAVTRFRRDRVGFVFQQYNLISYLTVTQNITLPQRFAGRRVPDGEVTLLLNRLGLDGLADRLPGELSGGQQQRVAIARALLGRPAVLFADEPTGALDTVSARSVLSALREAADAFGQTIVMVTHDPVVAAIADAVLFLADGMLIDRMHRPTVAQVADRMTHLDELVSARAAGAAS